ncbi:ROK family transcriptional regulator [Paenibacillus glycanilyticus]|uniref:ROK family transcriptional regulator n=1 Tax=Paenibacillus glycanilyticus TaxID=126569 RepID=UPI00203FF31B|nr:ROK family transcriptional regulator [Paenibacillus glycanilyticus]MCM3629637.1 ROK family transcriptional regulator [Paenibacillus glycanilyticus]
MSYSPRSVPSHKQLIYDYIANLGPVAKAELLEAHDLTSSTMTRLLDEMAKEGLILVTGLGPSNGGRKPLLYQVNPDHGYIFGLEISRFTSTLGLFDLNMNQKSVIRWRMDETMSPERLVAHAAGMMQAFRKDHAIGQDRILGLGIGAVGPLDRSSGMIINPQYFPAKGWEQVPICSMFEEATGMPTMLENGATTALVGEHWSIRHENVEHALYVSAGVSLRSAMMSYGRIVYGKVDTEGSIGQMIIDVDGPRLGDSGNYGSLETFASVQALERQVRTRLKLGGSLLLQHIAATPEQVNLDTITSGLNAGDPFIQEMFQQSASYFGIGLANLINMFHPELIILGGALINANPMYYQVATEVAMKKTYYGEAYAPQFSMGLLKEDAVVTGAALMVRSRMKL